MFVVPGVYDVVWKQDYDHQSEKIMHGVAIAQPVPKPEARIGAEGGRPFFPAISAYPSSFGGDPRRYFPSH
jgi:hypothetical protein